MVHTCFLFQNFSHFRGKNEYAYHLYHGFPGSSVVKNMSANAEDSGDTDSISGLGRSSGEGNGNPLQCSWFENPMGRGVWQAIVHGVTESDTTEQLSNLAPKKTHPVYHIPRKVRAALHI